MEFVCLFLMSYACKKYDKLSSVTGYLGSIKWLFYVSLNLDVVITNFLWFSWNFVLLIMDREKI